jgi:hypothetical protein
MKRMAWTAILLLAAVAAWGQSPWIIQNQRNKLKTAQKTWNAQQGTADAALAQSEGKVSGAAASAPDASQLLPADAVGTAKGEQRMADAARRDAYKRDPFLSPVVSRVGGPTAGCSGGKRCLAADSISLRGIVKSQDGMIAVVVNAANKAYFLRENDPIFNGYVARITSDSMVLRENTQDVLGRKGTRDIVKKLFVPAV